MKIYISGPMTGIEDYNRPAFFRAEEMLKGYFEVLNPARIEPDPRKKWSDYMREALKMLMDADVIYLLEGWHRSRGAGIEYGLATALDMTIIYENVAHYRRGVLQ